MAFVPPDYTTRLTLDWLRKMNQMYFVWAQTSQTFRLSLSQNSKQSPPRWLHCLTQTGPKSNPNRARTRRNRTKCTSPVPYHTGLIWMFLDIRDPGPFSRTKLYQFLASMVRYAQNWAVRDGSKNPS